ncbi:hypothetical protein SNEBB_006592, partial [Seison nebaliae]
MDNYNKKMDIAFVSECGLNENCEGIDRFKELCEKNCNDLILRKRDLDEEDEPCPTLDLTPYENDDRTLVARFGDSSVYFGRSWREFKCEGMGIWFNGASGQVNDPKISNEEEGYKLTFSSMNYVESFTYFDKPFQTKDRYQPSFCSSGDHYGFWFQMCNPM